MTIQISPHCLKWTKRDCPLSLQQTEQIVFLDEPQTRLLCLSLSARLAAYEHPSRHLQTCTHPGHTTFTKGSTDRFQSYLRCVGRHQ